MKWKTKPGIGVLKNIPFLIGDAEKRGALKKQRVDGDERDTKRKKSRKRWRESLILGCES
jgi:hypothetical protein